MKNHICNRCKFEMELVPPGCHQCHAAKVAIRNFKAHFLSVLAGVANDFEDPQFSGGGQTAPKLPHAIANTTKSSMRVTRLS